MEKIRLCAHCTFQVLQIKYIVNSGPIPPTRPSCLGRSLPEERSRCALKQEQSDV